MCECIITNAKEKIINMNRIYAIIYTCAAGISPPNDLIQILKHFRFHECFHILLSKKWNNILTMV